MKRCMYIFEPYSFFDIERYLLFFDKPLLYIHKRSGGLNKLCINIYYNLHINLVSKYWNFYERNTQSRTKLEKLLSKLAPSGFKSAIKRLRC